MFLAFKNADRAEFLGALDACHEHGVAAKVHQAHADSVLTAEGELGTFVDVDIEPWDVRDYLDKRMFDVGFAAIGLLLSLPLIVVIALAIKLDDGGELLYRQQRTAVFGQTFDVFKFRTMDEGSDAEMGQTLDEMDAESGDSRVTRVGRFLRQTHLDEIPQLWSILVNDMSVVGPRAVWTEEETVLETEADIWRKRWFVKPGLTGLAQIHGA